ncbi:MAG: HD domain-containing phosphohydrolase [Planctomycetota bacterium]
MLDRLRSSCLIRPRDWDNLPAAAQKELAAVSKQEELLALLIARQLITEYQAGRSSAGTTHGLIMGNYRVLDRLGVGGMGIVFKGEHLHLPRVVAIKVLPQHPEQDARLLSRFLGEIWAVAQLRHPNIVGAIDAGEVPRTDPNATRLHYFVMDYVAGETLEDKVANSGRVAVIPACDFIHQVASALTEANKCNLVHRDIKPSNVLVTPEGRAILLDFGLARQFGNRFTEPGTILGTIDYMAPEQAQDASSVDIRADIYGLGGTLYWCLTGRAPFACTGNPVQDLVAHYQAAPSVRKLQPDIPSELDAVVARMMAPNPDDRYAKPEEVMHALLPFIRPELVNSRISNLEAPGANRDRETSAARTHRVLIVDDEADVRRFCRLSLGAGGIQCDDAANGVAALAAIEQNRYDLILSDVDMPEMAGRVLLQRLRGSPPSAHLKIIMFSGRVSGDEMSELLAAGADDYLTKPLSIVQLLSRVRAALRLKDAQDRSDTLSMHMLSVNAELEQTLTARDSDLVAARNTLVLALADLVTLRDIASGDHLVRLQKYCRCLAEEASVMPNFAGRIDANFIRMLETSSPLHDIGKVGLPDHILLKPGKLDADERLLMQTHTTMGAETLDKAARRHGFAVSFMQMAIDIARHHHERFDGRGYPDQLVGAAIPLAARIVAIADVYDALRSKRPYKPALSHSTALHIINEGSPGQFDPNLLQALHRSASQFERIAKEHAD